MVRFFVTTFGSFTRNHDEPCTNRKYRAGFPNFSCGSYVIWQSNGTRGTPSKIGRNQ